jgi:hypothetical protein
VRLGRKPHDPAVHGGALRLPLYLAPGTTSLPRPPFCEYAAGIDLPAWGNLDVGDCTFAAFAALLAGWTHAATGRAVVLSDANVLAAYSALTGYDPSDPDTDGGAEEPDVLRALHATGVGGYRVDGYAAVSGFSASGFAMLESALFVFGGVSMDLALPTAAQDQVDAGYWFLDGAGLGDEWAPGSWGLHEAAALGYGPDGLVFRTWGRRIVAAWPWVARYATGAWALRSSAFLDARGDAAANGVDLASWDRDLAALGPVQK